MKTDFQYKMPQKTNSSSTSQKAAFGTILELMANKKKSAPDKEYLAFLKKRVESKNFKANVTPEEFAKTKEKYDREKLKHRLL